MTLPEALAWEWRCTKDGHAGQLLAIAYRDKVRELDLALAALAICREQRNELEDREAA